MHPAPLARILDANLNRAREGLRVMEDLARFALDDGPLCAEVKALRHALKSTADALPLDAVQRLAARDAGADAGGPGRGPGVYSRQGVGEIALAAAGRVTEALRSLEEAAKGLGAGDAARAFEALRYRAYSAEQRLVAALPTGRSRRWRLCVLITEALCAHHAWERVSEAAMDGGAECLQLREKALPDAELLTRAKHLVALARPRGVSVVINDRPDIALLSGADGVHLGQTDLPVGAVRALAGRRLLVGVSTSNPEEARRAVAAGADYCGVGPMFPTTTKQKDRLAGPAYLREYLALPGAGGTPHLAIGGITPENIGELAGAGCRGVAVSAVVCGADDPGGVSRALLAALPPP